MRSRFVKLLGLIVLFSIIAGCSFYPAPDGVDVRTEVRLDVFYDHLAPFGDWILIDGHGWVWMPSHMPSAWRPYTHGRWVYTSAGWTWYSDWDWGWIPFHYGRWLHHGRHGWIWIPGRVWGPGWVAWRSGHDWMGWAPLPPEIRWRVGIGLDLGGVDLNFAIGSNYWSFVPTGYLTSRDLGRHLAPRHRHPALLRETRDTTRYLERERRVVENGVEIQGVEQAQGGSVRRYQLEDLREPPNGNASRLNRGIYRIYRPKVREATPNQVPPRGKKGKKGNRN